MQYYSDYNIQTRIYLNWVHRLKTQSSTFFASRMNSGFYTRSWTNPRCRINVKSFRRTVYTSVTERLSCYSRLDQSSKQTWSRGLYEFSPVSLPGCNIRKFSQGPALESEDGISTTTNSQKALPFFLMPPPVPPYPCPHLTDKEIEVYLKPLYERGWGIHTIASSKDQRKPTFALAKSLEFTKNNYLGGFLGVLNSLAKQEQVR